MKTKIQKSIFGGLLGTAVMTLVMFIGSMDGNAKNESSRNAFRNVRATHFHWLDDAFYDRNSFRFSLCVCAKRCTEKD